MSTISESRGFDEWFELTETGVISCIKKKIDFINIFKILRHSFSSGYEKKMVDHAKKEFNAILKMIEDSEDTISFSEVDCERIIKEIHCIIKNLLEFVEFEFLN